MQLAARTTADEFGSFWMGKLCVRLDDGSVVELDEILQVWSAPSEAEAGSAEATLHAGWWIVIVHTESAPYRSESTSVALHSDDGKRWARATPPAELGEPIDRLVAPPDGDRRLG
jgi:hypothetical protein